jgi:thiamine-monophosphate kinase
MALSEFSLIERYFSGVTPPRPDVVLGVGDDCALLEVAQGRCLAVTVDTLVEGVHFLPGVDPCALGHKALAVSLSDLAAMGAEPAWATLALTLPRADEPWVSAFARGFCDLARRFGLQLVGGDTTRGPLSITVQAHGLVDTAAALRRDGAQPGDLVYVTGTLGEAGLALLAKQGLYVDPARARGLFRRLESPEPRIAEGLALRGLASAAIDVSDGLAADLGHLCRASGVGATVEVPRIPCSEPVRTYVQETGDWSLPLAAGDDYELCFTAPPGRQADVESLGPCMSAGLSWVGIIERQPGVRCRYADGHAEPAPTGYDHFASDG